MNEHIKDYCENFIESKDNPNFAIFIKGNWGVGKTYFINNLLKKYKKENTKKELPINETQITKISLFGVKSFDDIDTRIYQAIHPILSSEGMKLAGAVARTALKLGTNIDFNKDGKADASLSLGGFPSLKPKKARNISKKLLIVDDLERALLNPCEIFGYFSEIITDSSTKVIFIGNEDELIKNNKEYLKIKEKTIGIEFEIQPEKEAAIKNFIEKLELQDLSSIQNITLSLSNILECNNFRTIWQSLYNLKLLLSIIKDNLEKKDIEKIVQTFLVLFLQKNLNYISEKDDILSVLTAYFNYHFSYTKYVEFLEQKKNNNEYFFPNLIDKLPLMDCWKKIIFDGYYNKEWLLNSYEKEKKEIKEQNKPKKISNLLKLVNNWRTYSKSEFETLAKKVISEFNSGKYKYPGEILLYSSYMLIFSIWGLIPNKKESIISDFENLLKNENNNILPVRDWGSLSIGYTGYAFSSDVPEFMEIKKKLQVFNIENIKYHSKLNINKDVYKINTNIDLFIKKIIRVDGNMEYYRQPILSYLDINEFYKILSSLSGDYQNRIINAFAERYGKVYGNEPFEKEYAPDLENLKKLCDLYKANKSDVTYDPQKLFEQTMIKDLDELVIYVERKIKELGIQ